MAESVLQVEGLLKSPVFLSFQESTIVERTRKFRDNLAPLPGQLFEAKTDKGKSQTLEPRKRKLPKVNQGANTKQLTLFNFS
jgi:hypothetical protein